MTWSASATPSKPQMTQFKPANTRIVAYHNVSVSTYADGSRRASAGRLDLASNRMIFTRLSDPRAEWDCTKIAAHQLAEAAVELLTDAHDQLELF